MRNVLGGLDAVAEHVWLMRRCVEPWHDRSLPVLGRREERSRCGVWWASCLEWGIP